MRVCVCACVSACMKKPMGGQHEKTLQMVKIINLDIKHLTSYKRCFENNESKNTLCKDSETNVHTEIQMSLVKTLYYSSFWSRINSVQHAHCEQHQ